MFEPHDWTHLRMFERSAFRVALSDRDYMFEPFEHVPSGVAVADVATDMFQPTPSCTPRRRSERPRRQHDPLMCPSPSLWPTPRATCSNSSSMWWSRSAKSDADGWMFEHGVAVCKKRRRRVDVRACGGRGLQKATPTGGCSSGSKMWVSRSLRATAQGNCSNSSNMRVSRSLRATAEVARAGLLLAIVSESGHAARLVASATKRKAATWATNLQNPSRKTRIKRTPPRRGPKTTKPSAKRATPWALAKNRKRNNEAARLPCPDA
jgi:hypothetical protein